ncbi:MAG: DNA-binding Lrp family transcriptional regulator, partial [Sulfitobacter sp.]
MICFKYGEFMNDMASLSSIESKLLSILQEDASMSVADLAEA